MKKTGVVFVAIFLICISLFLMSTSANSDYSDVRSSDWFYEDVGFVKDRGLMNGTGENLFSPGAQTTRGMIVTILWRLDGSPDAEASKFEDVKPDAYYSKAISWASDNGIVTGYDAKHFGPDDVATREQFATIMYRYASYKGFDVTSGEIPDSISDKNAISTYAVEGLGWAYGEGLITGMTETTLAPKSYTQRSQVAAILRRFCENLLDEDSEDSVRQEDTTQSKEPAKPGATGGSGAVSRPSGSGSAGVTVVPTVSVENVYAAPGDMVSVPVKIKANPGVLGMSLTVYYDESVCTLVGAENGAAFSGVLDMTMSKTLNTGARFAWDGIEISEDDIRDGEILILNFKVRDDIKEGACPITLKMFDGDVLDNNLEELYLRADGGKIIIKK